MSNLLDAVDNPVLFRGGQDLLRWIESGGPTDRSRFLLHIRLQWAAFWFERLFELTQRRCATMFLPTKIVFIVGLWRSGSTVLHADLAQATGWATPRTWQCFSPADFLLKPAPQERHISRPMDHGVIGTYAPQEDEFAALLLGESSLYRAFIDPRRLDALVELLDQWKTSMVAAAPPLSTKWETFLKSVSSLNHGPMLLKSPNHTFRLPWLATRFPEARFIWLTRAKDDVLLSNHRMWSTMMQCYGLWRIKSHILDHFLISAIRSHDEILEWARSTIPERLTVASFDEVMNDRPHLVRRLVGGLS
jgi:omega-hydroxy-beta-dihydromenaquinone-9 sulfotransferase